MRISHFPQRDWTGITSSEDSTKRIDITQTGADSACRAEVPCIHDVQGVRRRMDAGGYLRHSRFMGLRENKSPTGGWRKSRFRRMGAFSLELQWEIFSGL